MENEGREENDSHSRLCSKGSLKTHLVATSSHPRCLDPKDKRNQGVGVSCQLEGLSKST